MKNFELSLKNGNKDAIKYIATNARKGFSGPVDLVAAYTWYLVAEALDVQTTAERQIKRMSKDMTPQEIAKARSQLQPKLAMLERMWAETDASRPNWEPGTRN